MICTIEELSLNALPALQTMHVGGWVLRFANGYTKRANSINPIYDSTSIVEEKIWFCEQLYRSKNLPVVFKMTSAVHPENLDAILDRCGYQIDSRTIVQTMDLETHASIQNAELNDTLTEEWLASFCQMNNIAEERMPVMRQMLGNIIPQKCFAAIRQHDQIVACGLAVLQNEYVGFYDIVTDAAFRKQGLSKRLMSSLLTWGKDNGARKAYLQVMLNNAPALQLYSRLGFQPVYQYWYRIKK
jgi:ribosomal protein S18 acetylase RimI-like enzyme